MLVAVPGSTPLICARCVHTLAAVLQKPDMSAQKTAKLGTRPQFNGLTTDRSAPGPLAASIRINAPARSPVLRTNVNCRHTLCGQCGQPEPGGGFIRSVGRLLHIASSRAHRSAIRTTAQRRGNEDQTHGVDGESARCIEKRRVRHRR
jgi:hypothetical protein